ncbi:unnamed protein product [Caenorhabditis angaria]|uniref:Uncharacterized protein n=1 Tax=Caenorhabditis angaria TaxID=860376 RepID=A0A9P1N7E5_9PELO|nr:unnamed protein product [Caenorhabditis angaria]
MGLLNCLVLSLLVAATTANVYSCGGFVKSSASIDFSKITVKLLTTEGHLKHEEEVNPSNGYFMIPVYSKGQYSLKVSSPAGYYFEPDTFDFKLDGVNDPCSKNEDIIFKLNGFSIRGVVDGAGAGLNLVLKSSSGEQIDSTVTTDGGKYEMKAPSGKYEVSTGAGASECISRGKANVEVSGAPVEVKPNLKISGYQLNVDTNNFASVTINIFSQAKIDLPNVKCSQNQSPNIPNSHSFNCELGKTNNAGKLSVACVPSANYYLTASFGNIQFAPSTQQITVSQSASNAKFVAESASSKVRVTANGKPFSDVNVLLNGKSIGKSDSNGYITLEGLKEGTSQSVTAEAKNVHFSVSKITVKFPTVSINDITVTKFDICGTVEKSENGVIESLKLSNNIEIRPNSDGSFCQSVAPGLYTIESSDKTSSLTPKSLQIDVTSKPILDLRFTHFKTDANVRVSCIGACPTSTVSLYLSGNNLVRSVKGTDVFIFEGIGPGTYKAKLDDNGRGCWENSELNLVVEQSKQQPTVHFVQNGFAAKIQLSHEADIKWENVDKKQLHGEAHHQGNEPLSICVPNAGVYSVSLNSCYKFERQQFEMNVPFEGVLKESAIAARIGGIVDLQGDKSAGVHIKIKSPTGERDVSVNNDGTFHFDEPLSSTGQNVHLVPSSSARLFEPTSKSIKVSGKCIQNAVQFQSFRGIFIDGQIRPAVEKVAIKAVLKSDPSVIISLNSDKNGNFKIGPVKKVEDYDISASLDGYRFSGSNGIFESIKLSQLSITVLDENTNEPLDGVLLSLVGGKDYRSNNVLDSTASKNFVDLAPGEYFIRAILQEYKFNPSTTTIQVKQGVHENVIVKGKRVSYSVFGKIREMSGSAVQDVVVEALSTGCDSHQSEAPTGSDGSFRLRGLLPNCKYNVYAKSYTDGSAAPHSFPGQFTVSMTSEDVKNLEFIATTIEKTTDAAIEIDMSTLKDIQSVRVVIHKENELVQTASIPFPQHLFYLSHLPRDGSRYNIRVEAEKPPMAFVAKTSYFIADAPIRVVRIPLTSSKKASEVDISFGSLMSLPFFVCLALAFFNQNRVLELLQSVYQFATAPNPTGDSPSQRKRK